MSWMETQWLGVVPNYLWPKIKASLMAATLGGDFDAYLKAQQAVTDADAAKVAADQAFTMAAHVLTVDLSSSNVKALLAPNPNADGTTPVALVNTDGTFQVINAVAPGTAVVAPEVTPVPDPNPAPPTS